MFSNPLDGDTQARIEALIQDILSGFATQFPLGYTVALVKKIKSEVDPPKKILDDCLLDAAPKPSEPLKKGFLTKRGDAHKNWKRRHCVAYNEADNFRIDYHDGEGGKIKGSINCSGYRVEKFNEEDETQMGPFGIKLVPWVRMRRTWYIRCDNEEDRTAWITTFQIACQRATAPSNPDPIIASAFNFAFWQVRWNYGFWGWYSSYGTEDERLGDFIREVLARDIVDAVLGNIAEGFFRAGLVNMVETTIATMVRSAVAAAWKTALGAVSAVSATIEATAKSNLTPIIEQQKALKVRIVDAIGSVTGPFLTNYGGKVCRPLLDGVARPISRAFADSIRCLFNALKERMTRDELSESKRKDTLTRLDYEAGWWWSGPLSQPKSDLWGMYSDAPVEVFAEAGGFDIWSLRYLVIEFLEGLFRRATYTLNKLATENPGVSILDHCNEVFRRYIHDAKLYLKDTFVILLRRILESPVNQLVTTPAKKLVEPVQAVIDAIPIPGLSTLFNLNDLLGEVVHDVLQDGLLAMVTGVLRETDAAIDTVSAELVF